MSDLVKPKAGALAAAPDFMQADGVAGTAELVNKMRPSWLKLVQKQSADELLTDFGMGSLVLTPEKRLVWAPGDKPRRIIPIFHFSEYLKFSSLLLKDTEPMIVERSFDPNSETARKANDPRLWEEMHPAHQGDSRYSYRYVHALVFMCVFQDPDLQSPLPFTISFSKASFSTGQSLAGKVVMRRAPLYGCVFELSVDPRPRKNTKGEWRELLIENPAEEPWVKDPEEYAKYKQLHERLVALHAAGEIEVGDAMDASEEPSTDVGTY